MIMRTSKWFSHYKYKDSAEYNIFCFVHAGGSSGSFSGWARNFGENINIIPVEYPMRERRFAEPMPDSIQELAKNLAEENEDFFRDKKFAFWGHCTGGLVAFETAKYLSRDKNLNAEYLFISSLTAPEFSQVPDISGMSDGEFTDFITESGFVAKELCENKEILEYFMPIARADFAVHRSYSTDNVKLDIPIILFNGTDDSVNVSESQIDAWENYTSKGIVKHYYSGNHFYINEHLSEVCAELTSYLTEKEKNYE